MIGINEKIKEARLKKDLSQRQVADALGWAPSTICRYEKSGSIIPEEREKKLITFFGFKETKTPKPVDDKSPDKFGLNKNSEGYTDTVMGEAIRRAMIKYTDHLPGEIWLHKRANGQSLNKLILNIDGNVAYCVTVFSNSARNSDFKIKDTAGNVKYIGVDRLEGIRLKELEKRNYICTDKSFEAVKLHMAALFGLAVVQKEVEVVKEVPVEKEVIKEVPVEKIVEVEKEVIKEVPIESDISKIKLLEKERDIYKDIVDRLLPRKEINV